MSLRLLVSVIVTVALVGAGCGTDDPGAKQDVTGDATAADGASFDGGSSADTQDDVEAADVTGDGAGNDAQDAAGSDASEHGDTATDVPAPECVVACDCAQGEACTEGVCVLGVEPVYCCSNAGCPAGHSCLTALDSPGLCGVDLSPLFGAVVINELLTDGAVNGDPNGDGDAPDPVGDEFVELVNGSDATVDLSGFTLQEDTFPTPRHTFPSGTLLPAGHALVVFGGGTAPDDSATAQFTVSNANEGAIPFGLHLDNEGDTLRLLDTNAQVVAILSYGVGPSPLVFGDESLTRSPDITGEFTPHSSVSDLSFSPGLRSDGTSF